MTSTDRRDIINHSMHFGYTALVRKIGRKWAVQFREFGFPDLLSTKTGAEERAAAWVRELSRQQRAEA